MHFILYIFDECALKLMNYKVLIKKWCKNYTIAKFTII